MDNIRFISGMRLMERWSVDLVELSQLPIHPSDKSTSVDMINSLNNQYVMVTFDEKRSMDFTIP